jgi:cytochrome c oxidase subunit IV
MSDHAHGKHGIGRYVLVWVALLALTAATVAVARVHLHQPWALVVALLVAVAKASLVALFFMHLWDHGGANRLVLLTSIAFLALLMGLVLIDNATRFPLANPPTEATIGLEPPGPDILAPRAPPPAHR